MPPGTPYNSFITEFPYIRVDEFTTIKTPARLHLLTHAHSDHIVGLQAKSFDQQIICSKDTKTILLRHEVYKERALHERELRAEKKRTYGHLKVDPLVGEHGNVYYQGSKDLLKVLPLNTPTLLEISGHQHITVTLIDANHMPGAVMFLIEGEHGTVLHTGDMRAEPWFLHSLKHNPFLQPYLSVPGAAPGVYKTLDAIYLDTASVMNIEDVPTKEDATTGLIALMRLFDSSTYFFLNTWTWGYEDILKAVAIAFGSHIHTDRYKHSIFNTLSQEPMLRHILTRDPTVTRFHACERFDRCDYVDVPAERHENVSTKGKRVVYVNPVSTMNTTRWRAYQAKTRVQILAKEDVTCLLVPLARHSPLPELRLFVDLFKPRTIVPNTLDPALDNLDWAAIHHAFGPHLRGVGSSPLTQESDLRVLEDLSHDEDGVDVSLKNLVGDQAVDLAGRWADSRGKQRKLEVIRDWLGIGTSKHASREYQGERDRDREDCESSSDIDGDERARTMHKLFAPQAGIQVEDSQAEMSSSSPVKVPQLPSPTSSPQPLQLQPVISPPSRKHALPVSPTDSPSSKKRRLDVQEAPSPLPCSSPFSTPTAVRGPSARAASSPDLLRRNVGPIRGSMFCGSPSLPRARGSRIKASASMPGQSRLEILNHQRRRQDEMRRTKQPSSDHSSEDDDQNDMTADILFGGYRPLHDENSSVAGEKSSDQVEGPLHDVVNLLEEVNDKTPGRQRPATVFRDARPTRQSVPPKPSSVSLPRATEMMREQQTYTTLRMRNLLKFRPGSLKLEKLAKRDSSLTLRIEHAEGRMQVLERRLVSPAASKPDLQLDRERIDGIMNEVKRALKEGRRVGDVVPSLECTFGIEAGVELSQAIEESFAVSGLLDTRCS